MELLLSIAGKREMNVVGHKNSLNEHCHFEGASRRVRREVAVFNYNNRLTDK